ncbi:hypothetical protein [Nostoc sp.]|uniref:hypothetical protein n=1 Tax=Nostoc sp. TaxID=1180 RepID=UPI002FF62BBC
MEKFSNSNDVIILCDRTCQHPLILSDRTFNNSIILSNACGERSDRYFPLWDYKIS